MFLLSAFSYCGGGLDEELRRACVGREIVIQPVGSRAFGLGLPRSAPARHAGGDVLAPVTHHATLRN
jgi:hypothetical protein